MKKILIVLLFLLVLSGCKSEEITAEAVNKLGTVNIDSTPSAEVYIDGTLMGDTPYNAKVTAGERVIEIKLNQYEIYKIATEVEVGKITKIDAVLTPLGTYAYSVVSTPSKAKIYVDGVYKGTTPTVLTGLKKGSHLISLIKTDYFEYKVNRTLNNDDNYYYTTNGLNAKLTPTSGYNVENPN